MKNYFFKALLLFTVGITVALSAWAENLPVQDSETGLLTISQGEFLQGRIPEIKIQSTIPPVTDPVVKINETPSVAEKSSGAEEGEAEKGLLGFSSGTTDILIKVFFAVLLLVIFILYRSRSGVSNKNVMRSIPKR